MQFKTFSLCQQSSNTLIIGYKAWRQSALFIEKFSQILYEPEIIYQNIDSIDHRHYVGCVSRDKMYYVESLI